MSMISPILKPQTTTGVTSTAVWFGEVTKS
jgi:hypothetical protein